MAKTTYLDYAAATPLDRKVLKAMEPYLRDRFANPSSSHSLGREQRKDLEGARARIAKALGAKPSEITFTSGSTEGANSAIQGVMKGFPRGRILVCAVEHESVLATAKEEERLGRGLDVLTVDADGYSSPEHLLSVIDDTTVLVCLQYANNEVGTIQSIAKAGSVIAQVRADRAARGITFPIYLYCDAAQAGLLNLQVARLGVDLLSMGGSKLYGPPGSGFLYIRTGTSIEPIMFGGGQESNRRSGTENVAAAVGLAEALELMQSERRQASKRLYDLSDWLWAALDKKIEGLTLNGSRKGRLPGVLNFEVEGADGETLVSYLDAAGFAVATGSACAAANQEPSHVLLALGRSWAQAKSSIRVSLGRSTTKAELEKLVVEMVKIVPRVRQLASKRN